MLPNDASQITEQDLQRLVDDRVAESRSLEFKSALPRPIQADGLNQDEFREEIASFANDGPGHLVLGIDEEAGIAEEVAGFEVEDPDAVIRHLDQLIGDGIDPPYRQHRIQAVVLGDGRVAFAIWCPRSYAAPHRVGQKGSVPARGAAGKYPMRMHQVREMVIGDTERYQRIEAWRRRRIQCIDAAVTGRPAADLTLGEQLVPAGLVRGCAVVAHLVPRSAFGRPESLALPHAPHIYEQFPTLGGRAGSCRVNLEGAIVSVAAPAGLCRAYTQVHRSGSVEGVWVCDQQVNGAAILPLTSIASMIRDKSPRWMRSLDSLGATGPFLLMLSLVGTAGAVCPEQAPIIMDPIPAERAAYVLHPIEITFPFADAGIELRPLFDNLWQAFGFETCQHYDIAGNWRDLTR